MTHYQKLATMIFRIIGVFFLVLAALSAAATLLFVIAGSLAMAFGDRGSGIQIALLFLIYAIPTSIIGYTFFKLSPYLAIKVCRNLQ
jgi:hypothetical protein